MSVSCEMYMGWTVKLVEGNVTGDDFEFFNNLEEINSNFEAFNGRYSEYTHDDTKVKLVVDGMSGEYVRLIYVYKKKELWAGDDCYGYEKLSNEEVPEEIYNELNECYKQIYNKDLDKSKVEYALWYHWS